MKYYSVSIERQILDWLKGQAVRAIAILGRTGRSVIYALEQGGKGCCFIPTMVVCGASSTAKVAEYEVFKFSDRTSFMVRNFKKPGKGGRMKKINNIYVGLQERVDGLELGSVFGCDNRFNRIIRSPQRIAGKWQYEIVLRGDWDMETIAMIDNAIARIEF